MFHNPNIGSVRLQVVYQCILAWPTHDIEACTGAVDDTRNQVVRHAMQAGYVPFRLEILRSVPVIGNALHDLEKA